MFKFAIRSALVVPVFLMLVACAGEKLQLEVKARVNGQPAVRAKVIVDGIEEGVTGNDGMFAKTLSKKAGAEVQIEVVKELPGYVVRSWKKSFTMKEPASGKAEKYTIDADLAAFRSITLAVKHKGTVIPDAVVRASGKDVGKTDAKGEFVYEYKEKELPATGLDLVVSREGYAPWQKSGAVEPGQRIEVSLIKRVTIAISALTDEYGQTSGIPGLTVSVDDRPVGSTDSAGGTIYRHDGETGKKVRFQISAPGYLPAIWQETISLDRDANIRRYFYPVTPRPIRMGIYRFVSNTPNADLKNVLSQTEQAVGSQLFKNACFHEVSAKTLQTEMKHAKLSIEKITTKGWRDTVLQKSLDLLILGSLAKDANGFLIEAKFYTAAGRLIMSQIARAKDANDIVGAAKDLAQSVMDRFPFEGTVISSDNERYRINLGKAGYKISKGADFSLMAARFDEAGRISGYRETGKLRVKKLDDAGSWTEVADLKPGENITIGDRAIRRAYREGEEEAERNFFIISAKGGLLPDVAPLATVNIYVNGQWIGSTGADGKAEVPVRLNKKLELVLYRHGYQQVVENITIGKKGDIKEYVLNVNNSLFKVDSQPSSADVFVDGEKLGRTPILDGKLVNLGFHTVKVTLGSEYRDWEEVLEFASKVEDRTGDRKIVLFKDFLKIGERAEQKNDFDAAIQAYKSAEKGHPDYSEARHRLAQIYLDEKNDYDGAIREFENVLALPENAQLIYKQFSVAFTNLGHAYYEKGSALVQANPAAAAQAFGMAIQNLQIAKQNMRFFPNVRYDEAVHDTYYYMALSYHKLYLMTKKNSVLNSANLAWQEYFDFFPKKLEGNSTFDQARDSSQKYWDQIKGL